MKPDRSVEKDLRMTAYECVKMHVWAHRFPILEHELETAMLPATMPAWFWAQKSDGEAEHIWAPCSKRRKSIYESHKIRQ